MADPFVTLPVENQRPADVGAYVGIRAAVRCSMMSRVASRCHHDAVPTVLRTVLHAIIRALGLKFRNGELSERVKTRARRARCHQQCNMCLGGSAID